MSGKAPSSTSKSPSSAPSAASERSRRPRKRGSLRSCCAPVAFAVRGFRQPARRSSSCRSWPRPGPHAPSGSRAGQPPAPRRASSAGEHACRAASCRRLGRLPAKRTPLPERRRVPASTPPQVAFGASLGGRLCRPSRSRASERVYSPSALHCVQFTQVVANEARTLGTECGVPRQQVLRAIAGHRPRRASGRVPSPASVRRYSGRADPLEELSAHAPARLGPLAHDAASSPPTPQTTVHPQTVIEPFRLAGTPPSDRAGLVPQAQRDARRSCSAQPARSSGERLGRTPTRAATSRREPGLDALEVALLAHVRLAHERAARGGLRRARWARSASTRAIEQGVYLRNPQWPAAEVRRLGGGAAVGSEHAHRVAGLPHVRGAAGRLVDSSSSWCASSSRLKVSRSRRTARSHPSSRSCQSAFRNERGVRRSRIASGLPVGRRDRSCGGGWAPDR